MAVTTNSTAREDSAILLKLVSGKAVQGGMLVFQTKAGTKIILDGLELPVSADGLFVLGFHRDDVTPQELRAMDASGKTAKLTLTPEMRDWEIQRIDNLPTNMVTPPEAVITRIKKDIKNVKAARAVISDFDDVLKNGFVWPVWGRISGIYGAQRILNGKPRQPHYGIDIAAPSGVAVRAAGAGRVTMAMDLYFTGGTVIIDHGFGLNSTYSHLKDMNVRPGDRVTRGGVIGSVGSTGRSTGPHLDWRINWRHKRLDPLLIAGPLRPALPASRPK
jgi:murein DD-endopeptidase MepM/ murein hydrolase activator NlpD